MLAALLPGAGSAQAPSRERSLEVKTTDRYGRTVAEVIGDINIYLAMVEDGQAFACRAYLGDCDAKEIGSYDRAQELLRQGHTYLDGNGDGQACEALR